MTEGLGTNRRSLRGLPPQDLLMRFGFGAGASVLAGLVTLAAGERVGGLFLAFPAILVAALTLIEKREGTSQAVSDVRGAAVGSLGMVVFALTVMALATRMPTIAALGVGVVAWLEIGRAHV